MTIVWGGRPRNPSSIPGRVKRFISSPQRLGRFWIPLGHISNAYTGSFPRDQAGNETARSPLSSAEVKITYSCTSTFPYVFSTWCLTSAGTALTFFTLHERTPEFNAFCARHCAAVSGQYRVWPGEGTCRVAKKKQTKKLRGFSSQANYTARATATCRRN
jgi:hypothetical protein